MAYLAHTAHWQFFALVLAVIGLIMAAATAGVDDWRVWHVNELSGISPSSAWVGVWRACLYSHTLERARFCSSMWPMDRFLPSEILAAQALCTLAVPVGILANLLGGYAVRRAYFNVRVGRVRAFFLSAALLYFLTASCLLVPVVWNLTAVLQNRTIDFPPEFFMPPAPDRQEVGLGIIMGIGASAMLLISGLLFLLYWGPQNQQTNSPEGSEGGMENRSYTQEETKSFSFKR